MIKIVVYLRHSQEYRGTVHAKIVTSIEPPQQPLLGHGHLARYLGDAYRTITVLHLDNMVDGI